MTIVDELYFNAFTDEYGSLPFDDIKINLCMNGYINNWGRGFCKISIKNFDINDWEPLDDDIVENDYTVRSYQFDKTDLDNPDDLNKYVSDDGYVAIQIHSYNDGWWQVYPWVYWPPGISVEIDVTTVEVVYIDNIAPTWDVIPSDQQIEAGAPFSYDVDASDNIAIDHYWLSDAANFNIDINGLITSIGTLSVGTYPLTIGAYDDNNNYCDAIISITVEDTIAPTVSITNPADENSIRGIISVSASASDNVGVTLFEFYVDGVQTTVVDNSGPFNYQWDTTTISDGNHEIEVVAYDAVGNSNSDIHDVIIDNIDTEPPILEINSPIDGAIVSGTVSVTTSVSDNFAVDRIEFYINNVLMSTVSSSPYSYQWDTTTYSDGDYEIKAIAFDTSGNTDTDIHDVIIDRTAPDVSITYPSPSARVSGPITISATATDNIGVTQVNFYIDNNLRATDSSTPYSYQWNTISYSVGNHDIKVIAYDAAGNSDTDIITVYVKDQTPPSVSITSPASGAVVKNAITVSVSASDNIGVTQVIFYVDGTQRSIDTSAPYSFQWDTTTYSDGSHSLMARAYDAEGNYNSATITVSVKNHEKFAVILVHNSLNSVHF